MPININNQSELSGAAKTVMIKVEKYFLRKPVVLALCGPLGAGKTAFTKALGNELGINPNEITSPTFTLHMEHAGEYLVSNVEYRKDEDHKNNTQNSMDQGDSKIHNLSTNNQENSKNQAPNSKTLITLDHLDVWRVEDWNEVERLGLEVMLKPGHVVVMEWADKFKTQVDKLKSIAEVVWMRFEYGNEDNERIVTVGES